MSSGLEMLDAGRPMEWFHLEKIGTTMKADAIICVGGGGLDAFQGFLLDNEIPILVLTGNFAMIKLKQEARELVKRATCMPYIHTRIHAIH